jgi:uncharacterized membrane protein YfcA
MEFTLGYEILAMLFAVAFVAGFIDTLAGGGGLLVLPMLLSVGLPPAQALATNKLQSVGGSFSSSLYFVRRRVVNLAEQKWVIFFTFVGASIGVCLVQFLQADFLSQMLPVLVIAVGLYFLFSPNIGEKDSVQRISILAFGMTAGASVGFYDGFFGPGAGSFFALAYVTLLGLNLPKATAHAKVLNFTSNLAALLFFIIGGKVVWSIGLVMLVGQFLGARIGANLVLSKGQKLIRPMLICVSTVMSVKLIYEHHGAQIQQWFS